MKSAIKFTITNDFGLKETEYFDFGKNILKQSSVFENMIQSLRDSHYNHSLSITLYSDSTEEIENFKKLLQHFSYRLGDFNYSILPIFNGGNDESVL